MGPEIRWTDRVQSSSGDWTGNVFEFYFRVYNKLFNLINIGERAGSGIPDVYLIWDKEGLKAPVIEEYFAVN
ncbi:MAG: hypothetical protein J6N52_13820 [Clostridia bacterium]|nr:hypothetical protein [Clostridia bacterium]